MIAFATLLLGLVLGPFPIDLVVADGVARVEILLDQRPVGVLTGEPWRFACDFGEALEPHELVAVAFDAEGREVGRARQFVNLPHPPAEATLVLDADGRTARAAWKSLEGERPRSFEVRLDGAAIEVDDPSTIQIPPVDRRVLHLLSLRLEFTDNVSAVAELVFGGEFSDQTSSELTMFPVRLPGKGELPPLAEIQGWVWRGETAARLVATEAGPAEVVVVLDPGARPGLAGVAAATLRLLRPPGATTRGVRSQIGGPPTVSAAGAGSRALRFAMALADDQRLRFLWPIAERREQGELRYDLFPPSQEYDASDGGVLWLLTRSSIPGMPSEGIRLADAVAAAGVTGATRHRRRAVVLVLGPQPQAEGLLHAESVRHYLGSLGVPLHIWSTERARKGERAPWSEVVEIDTPRKLEGAVAALRRDLERQRLLWVEGIHLPNSLHLLPGAAVEALVR